ncbi:MAG: tetratricopeptide repeat protein, partial [Alphaproteobacteria bacterium]|nr:tetratricopeptide repeat protein [Alphaproteobacteria bacterium]
AQAYSGLADAYALAGAWEYGVLAPGDAAPRAKAAATRAVQLDPMSSEAHTSLAFALEQYPWDWVAAGHEFRRALELNPGYAIAHDWYGYHLITIGRVADGIAELRTAENLDPLSLIISAGLADALFIAHRYDEAMRQLHKTLELDPNYAIAHNHVGEVLVQQGNATASIPEFQRAIEVSGHNWAFDANLAYAYALSGRSEDAQAIVDDLTLQHHDNGNVAANIALAYMGFGNADLTMHWLDVAYDTRFEPVILVRPQFDNLRSDPRFQGLMRRVGLEPAAHAR